MLKAHLYKLVNIITNFLTPSVSVIGDLVRVEADGTVGKSQL